VNTLVNKDFSTPKAPNYRAVRYGTG